MEQTLNSMISSSESIDILVSFLKESGLSIISDSFREALSRGTKVRILTGTYLNITTPFALEQLLQLKGNIEVRLFSDPTVSFHPKAYIFHYPDRDQDELIIGSSNLSSSALTDGVEWNYHLKRSTDPDFQSIWDTMIIYSVIIQFLIIK